MGASKVFIKRGVFGALRLAPSIASRSPPGGEGSRAPALTRWIHKQSCAFRRTWRFDLTCDCFLKCLAREEFLVLLCATVACVSGDSCAGFKNGCWGRSSSPVPLLFGGAAARAEPVL